MEKNKNEEKQEINSCRRLLVCRLFIKYDCHRCVDNIINISSKYAADKTETILFLIKFFFFFFFFALLIIMMRMLLKQPSRSCSYNPSISGNKCHQFSSLLFIKNKNLIKKNFFLILIKRTAKKNNKNSKTFFTKHLWYPKH